MNRRCTVTFRGEPREVEYDWIYEPDVGMVGVDGWWFPDLTPEQHDALKITDAEEQSICDQCAEHYHDALDEP